MQRLKAYGEPAASEAVCEGQSQQQSGKTNMQDMMKCLMNGDTFCLQGTLNSFSQ